MNKPVEENEMSTAPDTSDAVEGKSTKETPEAVDGVDDNGPSSIGQIPEGIVGDMPDVQEHVVEAMAQDAAKVETATADNDGREDASGNLFNPARHAVDESGNPLQTPTGRWKKISKNAKPANSGLGPTKATNSSLGGVSAHDVGPAPESDATLKARSAGVAAANALFGVCMMVDGDEWKPDANERKVMETTYGDYMVAQGITDIPPGVAVALVTFAYVSPRFAKPKTRNWFGARWESAKAWAQTQKAKRAKQAQKKSEEKPNE